MSTVQNQNWFGNPNILERFSKENGDFIENTLPLLQLSFDLVHKEIGQIRPLNKTQTTLSSLSILTYEDFFEILTLCGFGKGNGAKKILRGMFERTVTLCYLKDNPDEVENFWRFGDVTARKRALVQKEQGTITNEEFEQIERAYQAVKERFRITVCEKCNVPRPSISWSKIDIVSMARKVGLHNLIDKLYYDPMQETHTSVAAIRARFTTRVEDGKNYADYRNETDWSELTKIIEQANFLIFTGLVSLDKFFSFPKEVQEAIKAYSENNLNRLKSYLSAILSMEK